MFNFIDCLGFAAAQKASLADGAKKKLLCVSILGYSSGVKVNVKWSFGHCRL